MHLTSIILPYLIYAATAVPTTTNSTSVGLAPRAKIRVPSVASYTSHNCATGIVHFGVVTKSCVNFRPDAPYLSIDFGSGIAATKSLFCKLYFTPVNVKFKRGGD